MSEPTCMALHSIILAVVRSRPTPDDVADLFDLLGYLDLTEKQTFWTWLGLHAPNVKRWLMATGSEYRRAA